MDIKEVLSENLKRLRKRTGKSQDAFAQFVGVPFRTYQNIEGGNSWPEYDNLVAIAQGLGVEPQDLFADELTRLRLIADLASLDKPEFDGIFPVLRGAVDSKLAARAGFARKFKDTD